MQLLPLQSLLLLLLLLAGAAVEQTVEQAVGLVSLERPQQPPVALLLPRGTQRHGFPLTCSRHVHSD